MKKQTFFAVFFLTLATFSGRLPAEERLPKSITDGTPIGTVTPAPTPSPTATPTPTPSPSNGRLENDVNIDPLSKKSPDTVIDQIFDEPFDWETRQIRIYSDDPRSPEEIDDLIASESEACRRSGGTPRVDQHLGIEQGVTVFTCTPGC